MVRTTGSAASVTKWLAAALLLAGVLFGWHVLPLRDWADAFTTWVHGLGIWGVIAFIAGFVGATMILVPASVITLAAGLSFGFWAFPLALAAATAGAAATFALSRYAIRDRVKRLVADHARSRAVYRAVSAGGWNMLFLLRLSPVMPFGVLNYVLGATEMGFWTFISATLAGIIPSIALYSYLGALGRTAVADPGIGTMQWVLLILGLIAAAAAILYVARRAAAELSKSELR